MFEELPGVGTERLDVFSSSFSVNSIECKRAFTRATYAGNHNEFITRNAQVDILKVMLRRTGNFDCFVH